MRIGCAVFILILLALLGVAGFVAFGDPPPPTEERRVPVAPAAQ